MHIAGILDIPEEFKEFKDRVIAHPFMNWKELPSLIAEMDINLAPIEESIFNEAKSENKWVEAALVRVPTIASKVGAFDRMIENGKTGVLCTSNEEWYTQLEKLVLNSEWRSQLGRNAYRYCSKNVLLYILDFNIQNILRVNSNRI